MNRATSQVGETLTHTTLMTPSPPTNKTISLPLLKISHSSLPTNPQKLLIVNVQKPKMHKTQLKPMNTLFIVLLFLFTHLKINNGVSVLGLSSLKTSEIDPTLRRVCAREIGECGAEMDSESNRRVLMMNRGFISYETLKRDLVPCTRPGASYYNCKAAGEANPYHRGCEVITACARDISDIKT
ncbi:protein RALF-like 24 [Actinidia eriantha]|uniref:protein RALF-like 24 n=1 Tax=Actinidia eriantha TaxID=165200 RepID=UPI002584BD70|nr:protein RALF-like 24 [Actinidia eriantha]